jgi:hypothetical protein
MQLFIPRFWLLLTFIMGCLTLNETCPIAQYYQFYIKDNINDYEIIKNPYKKPSA